MKEVVGDLGPCNVADWGYEGDPGHEGLQVLQTIFVYTLASSVL